MSFRDDLVGMQNELRRFAYNLTTNKEEISDLLQDTFMRALENEDKYTPGTNFRGWIYTIMRNVFINNYRRMICEQTYISHMEDLYYFNSLSQGFGFYTVERAYDLKEIRRAINALPIEYKVPFSMYVAGFKYREIAHRFGVPLGTIKSRIFYTRQRLQYELRDFKQ
ncbi:MAG: RNA polymerase sigma factor [Mediterranea sp.]|jgi:RNA polymerase sigma-70 factor (ECF subfamily)|nr:RNA polymerase sigma factor [Mediterranea sp.]